MTEILRTHADVLAQYHPHFPLHPGRRIPGYQRRPVSLAAPARPDPPQHLLRRRRRPVDLFLARRRGRKHPALRARFPRRQDRPPGAQLPLHRAHSRRRLRADRPQRRPPRQNPPLRPHHDADGEQVTVLGLWDSDEEARAVGDRIESLKRSGNPLSPKWPSWSAPASRPAPSRNA